MKYKEKIYIPANYSLTKAIIDILFDLGENMTLLELPYKRAGREWRRFHSTMPEMWRYKRAVKYLEKRAKIKVIEKNNKIFLKLTRKGKLQALMDKIEKDFHRPLIWDRKWRLIMWDIPEKASVSRNRLRRFVKDLSFLQLQKSVFITPYQIPSAAVEYLKESKLIRYIRFLRVDKIEDDRYFKKKYRLK